MKRRCLKNGGREKAFWGAVVSGLVGLAGSLFGASANSKAQKEAIEAQKRAQMEAARRQQLENSANTINNYFNTVSQEPEQEYIYKSGGRRKLRNVGARITDGGYAIPIGNNISLLQGRLHSQVNESGNTGIGIKVGNTEIEAENGEVVQKKGDEFRIFSAQPMFAGISPAEAVMEGADEDKVFKAQESIKKRYNLRNGKSTPVERKRALWGATFTTPDYIGLGTNIGASLLSGIYANALYNNLAKDVNYALPGYVDETYVSGPTKVEDAAQKAAIKRMDINARNEVLRNTASANVGVGRNQEIGTNTMYELMKVADATRNKNIELRQANADREQQVRARNAAARNAYYQRVAEIKNQQLATRLGLQQAKVDSNVGMIQGIGSSIGGFLQQGIDNYQADQSMRAMLAASPYGTAEKLYLLGYDFDKDLRNDLANLSKYRMSQYGEDTPEYKQAANSWNLWTNGYTPYKKNRYSLRNVPGKRYIERNIFTGEPVTV